MFEIKLTLSATPELLETVKALAAAFGKPVLVRPTDLTPEPVTEAPAETAKPEPVTEAPAETAKPEPAKTRTRAAAPKTEPATEPAPEKVKPDPAELPLLTLEVIREKTAEIAKTGKREEIKALLAEFEASNVFVLKAEQYPAYLSKLVVL